MYNVYNPHVYIKGTSNILYKGIFKISTASSLFMVRSKHDTHTRPADYASFRQIKLIILS